MGAARRGAAGVIKTRPPSSTTLDCINLTGVYRFNGFLLQREAANVLQLQSSLTCSNTEFKVQTQRCGSGLFYSNFVRNRCRQVL